MGLSLFTASIKLVNNNSSNLHANYMSTPFLLKQAYEVRQSYVQALIPHMFSLHDFSSYIIAQPSSHFTASQAFPEEPSNSSGGIEPFSTE